MLFIVTTSARGSRTLTVASMISTSSFLRRWTSRAAVSPTLSASPSRASRISSSATATLLPVRTIYLFVTFLITVETSAFFSGSIITFIRSSSAISSYVATNSIAIVANLTSLFVSITVPFSASGSPATSSSSRFFYNKSFILVGQAPSIHVVDGILSVSPIFKVDEAKAATFLQINSVYVTILFESFL